MVDTGPLVAAAIRTDPEHELCSQLFDSISERLVVPQPVVAETAYLVGRIAGAAAEALLLRDLETSSVDFEPFQRPDLRRAAELIETYADLPLGTVDAIVIATAERLGTSAIATLDRRHFTVVRPNHVKAFEIIP